MTGSNVNAITRQIPNALTLARIILAIVGALALWQSFEISSAENGPDLPSWLAQLFASPEAAVRGLARLAVISFVIAAITDWLDGYLARRWSAESGLGAFLDPIADKVLVNGYLLAYAHILDGPVRVVVPVAAIVLRDVAITLIRWSSPKGVGDAVRVSPAAKMKTALAIATAGFPLLAFVMGWQTSEIALLAWIAALWLTAALSLLTGLEYWRRPSN